MWMYLFCPRIGLGNGKKAANGEGLAARAVNRPSVRPSVLFTGGCGDKGVSEPVGLGRAGGSYRRFDRPGFIRRHSNRKDHCGDTLPDPWTPHFLFHKTVTFRVRKYLTRLCTFVYKCLVLNYRTKPFQQSARTSLERLVTRDTRREPGRAMKG